MKIGLDFWNCISQYPEHFRGLARAWIDAGFEVHIISAYGDRQLEKYNDSAADYLALIQGYEIPCTSIALVYFGGDDKTIPELKYEVIKRLGVEIMIDDRPGTIQYLHERGIMALQVQKPIKIHA